MSIPAFFAENPVAPATRQLYERALNKFIVLYDPATCSAGDILKFLDGTKWGSSLRYTSATAIKKYIRWKYGAEHPALRMREKREKTRPGRTLTASVTGDI